MVSPEIWIEPSPVELPVSVTKTGAVTPLIVKLACSSVALPTVGWTAVTTTLICAKRSTSKKSGERRCLSRRPMPENSVSSHQRRNFGGVEILVDAVDQTVGAHPDHDANAHGDRLAGMTGGVQDVLLDKAADRAV